jgi:RNA polymerase sigma-70 factor (ECF subfamily)
MPSFPTTRWTLILHAGQTDSAARTALAELCQAYWYPLYAFVRRRGHAADDAQDLTQAFFAHVLEHEAIGRATADKGRFRTFLLAALKNYLANEWDKARAQKRGGGETIISLDHAAAEERYRHEPSHDLTPERLFERRWALTLLDQVLAKLQQEYHADGKAELFEALKPALVGGGDSYALLAARLGRSEGAMKVAAHRLRQSYRALIRREIAETVADGDLEDEVLHLLAVLAE